MAENEQLMLMFANRTNLTHVLLGEKKKRLEV